MTDTITLSGLVATVPRHVITSEGLAITSFRLASTQRRYDRVKQGWTDGETNWYTVTTFRQLAINVAASVSKGERIVVAGRVRIRDWTAGEKTGTTVEVDADSLGHDLMWGTTVFARSITASAASVAPQSESAEGLSSAEQPSEGADVGVTAVGPADEARAQAVNPPAEDAWAVAPTDPVPVPF